MGDPTLTALIEEALRRNQTVRAGWARVRAGSVHRQPGSRRAHAADRRAGRLFGIGREHPRCLARFNFQNATGSLPISYEVDLFARRAREHQGAKLDAEAARLDQEALAITISAEVAEAWFDSINSRIEVAVVQEQLETDLKFLELVELRYREGSELRGRRAPTASARREPARAPRPGGRADRSDRPAPFGVAGRGSWATLPGRWQSAARHRADP